MIIGDANAAIDKILHMQGMFGITRFSAFMDVGGPEHLSIFKFIKIFGTKIAPKVERLLETNAKDSIIPTFVITNGGTARNFERTPA